MPAFSPFGAVPDSATRSTHVSTNLPTVKDADGHYLAANGLPYLTGRECPKCSDGDAMVEYVRLAGSECATRQIGCPTDVGEHMHRRCRECGFEWPEACDDTPPLTEPPSED